MPDERDPSQSGVPHRGGSTARPSPALIAAFIALCALSVVTTLLVNFRCRNGLRWGRYQRRPPARPAHARRSASHPRKKHRRAPRLHDAYLNLEAQEAVGWKNVVPLAASVLPSSPSYDKMPSEGKRIRFQDPSKHTPLDSDGIPQPTPSCPLSIYAPAQSILVPPPPIQVQVIVPILMPVAPGPRRGGIEQDASVCLGTTIVPLSTRGLGRG
ncbi:uncharacterized protein SCHCODRAFT_02482224 [Schizophyllum commune H4-8]|nr:uncharacterized protein SCHCODRAFT_02482224 [Schizophyllum commune H4-8]KAI5899031.1 hypothetical protein SCHCODRAFT_02482224 [Schizophyllum commune H4-8]